MKSNAEHTEAAARWGNAVPGMGLNFLIWAGSALLAVSAVVHFHLWGSAGYRHIPTIGPLFLAQAIIGVVLSLATAVFRKLVLVAGAAGLAVSSIGALLISVWWGLFGWQESSSAPYVGLVLWVEALAAVFLGAAFVLMGLPWLARAQARRANRPEHEEPLRPTVALVVPNLKAGTSGRMEDSRPAEDGLDRAGRDRGR